MFAFWDLYARRKKEIREVGFLVFMCNVQDTLA